MDTKVNYTLVGAFVIILLAFIVFSIIWLSSGISSGQTTYYEIYMKESVSGLNVDSSVEFNGVNVGNVKKVEIDSKDPRLVYVLISIKNKTPVTQGTRAMLNSKGLTGITYLSLVDDGSNLKPLIKTPNEPYPIINTAPSFFFRIDTGMKKINENLTKVSNSIQALLDEENLRSIKEILLDLRHVTRTLALHTDQIDTILHNTAVASGQFIPLLESSEHSLRMLTTQVLPATSKAMQNLDIITNDLSVVSHEMRNNPAVIIRGKTPQPLGPGEQ